MTGDGRWQDMFEPRRPHPGIAPSPPAMAQDGPPDDEALTLDLSVYRPWLIQRGRSRPALMLEFRRYDAKSGLWSGWAIAYPQLVALEYLGDRMLSLDFGIRRYILEGAGLDELVRHLQQGSVLAVQEYSASLWPSRPTGPFVSAIRLLGQADTAPPR